MIGAAFILIVAVQAVLALRVLARFIASASGRRIRRCTTASRARVSVIVPVLNERTRLGACLDGLIRQPEEVAEILVVDGGSSDGTQDLIVGWAARDARVRLVDAGPAPAQWTGKTWGLHNGLVASDATSDFVLCLDADVHVDPALVRSLLAHAGELRVDALSVASRQHVSGAADGLLHPALLTTLVYRFGMPGGATSNPAAVQANGQCFLARRELLLRSGALAAAQASLCEDITIARRIAAGGDAVGFYETDGLVEVQMYAGWRDTWRNWPRSLPMRDQYFGWPGALGLAEVLFVQALPLPMLALGALAGAPTWLILSPAALLAMRLGVLSGMARAYIARPWTYWLSPIADLPAALALIRSALQRRHAWRGRHYVRDARGRFQLAASAPPNSIEGRPI